MKAHSVDLEMYRVQNLYMRSLVMQTCQNDFGFSLYAALFICHVVTISNNWLKSKKEVSVNNGVLLLLLNTRD